MWRGALQYEAAYELGVAEREVLREHAASREPSHMRAGDPECAEDFRGVVGHHLLGLTGPSGMAVRPAPRLSKAVMR